MKFKVETEKFKTITYAMDKVFFEGFFRVEKDCLKIKEPDGGNHSIMIIDLPESFFESFDPQLDDGEQKKIGFSATDLKAFVDNIDSEILEVSVEDAEILLSGDSVDYKLPVLQGMDDFGSKIDMDDKSYKTEMVTKTGKFVDGLDKMYIVDAPIDFTHEGEDLHLGIHGEAETHDASVVVDAWNSTDERSDTIMGQELLKPIKKILGKHIDSSTDLELEFGTENPLIISPSLEEFELTYMITPRIPER